MDQKKCQTTNCSNETKGNRKHCSTCRWRKWKNNNLFKYHFYNLRNRARQRGKKFTITFEDFKEIWQKHPKKWKHKITCEGNSIWQLDRIKEEKGYVPGNLQILKYDDNTKKYREQAQQSKDVCLDEEAPF